MTKFLLCSDLDRTILPNGGQPLSENVTETFCRFIAENSITLVYVSGRNKTLLEDAIREYPIPTPDYAIGDVGTTIYTPADNWNQWQDWETAIAKDWNGKQAEHIVPLLSDLDMITLQEEEKQNSYKLSYYASTHVDSGRIRHEILARLHDAGMRASIIWSIDEQKDIGLIDILPERATKLHAVKFIMEKSGFSREHTLFAGDSGNDLPALTSDLNAVLVKNGPSEVRQEAVNIVEKKGLSNSLYIAKGDFLGLNGNYCAGVLEGMAHFFPGTLAHIKKAMG